MSSLNPVPPEPADRPWFRLHPLGSAARKIWLVAVIAVLLLAVAPLVHNLAMTGVNYFVGPEPSFDPANPDNYPNGHAGYVVDLLFTGLLATAFFFPFLLMGALAVLSTRAPRTSVVPTVAVSLASVVLAATAGFWYTVAGEPIDPYGGWVFFDVIQVSWVATIVSTVVLLLSVNRRPNRDAKDRVA